MVPSRRLLLTVIAVLVIDRSSAGESPNDYPTVIPSDQPSDQPSDPPMIGLFPSPVPPEEARRQGLPDGTGVYVVGVIDGSMAAGMGLRQGDVVLSFNGTRVDSYDDIVAARDRFHAGDHAEMEFVRDGVRARAGGTLGSWPRADDQVAEPSAVLAEAPAHADVGDAAHDGNSSGIGDLMQDLAALFASAPEDDAAAMTSPWRLTWSLEPGPRSETPPLADIQLSVDGPVADPSRAWCLGWSNAR